MSFNNISLDFDFRYETPFFTGCRNQEIFIKFVINESKYFTLLIKEDGNYGQYGFFALQWFINGENSSLINKTFTPDNQWHSINMTIVDNKVSVLYDGTTQISQFLVSELGSLTFSDLSVKFTGWDDTVSDSYRNIDNITLKSSRYIQQDVPSAPYLNAITSPSTTGNITLSWGAAPGATSYKIYRSNLPITSVTGLQPIKTDIQNVSYLDLVATNGTYYYVVVATNGSGDSEISNCRSVTVGIPENLILNADFSQTRNFSAFGHSVLVNNSFISPTVHNNKVFNSWNLHPEEGFERFYSFMGELKNLRTSLLELGLNRILLISSIS